MSRYCVVYSLTHYYPVVVQADTIEEAIEMADLIVEDANAGKETHAVEDMLESSWVDGAFEYYNTSKIE